MLFAPPVASGASSRRAADDKPVLFVLLVAQGKAVRVREEIFVNELALTLGAYRIVAVDKDLAGFSDKNLNQQLSQIKVIAEAPNTVATIWIEEGEDNITLLHLVALSTGRALVRIVEAKKGPETEITLAMAVEELVGQAYLFEAKKPDPAVEKSVVNITNRAISNINDPDTIEMNGIRGGDLSLVTAAVGRFGVVGGAGSRFGVGGGLGLESRLHGSLYFAGGVAVISILPDRSDQHTVSLVSVEPHMGVTLLKCGRPLTFGVGFFISVPWRHASITLPSTGNHTYNDWDMRPSLRLDLRINLGRNLALLLVPDIGVRLNQKRYYKKTTDVDIIKTPRMDLGLLLGFILKI